MANPQNDLSGRSFFVTGANSGIGRATVEALAARGADVVLASRSEEKTRPVLDAIKAQHPGAKVDFVALDLGDLKAVKRTAEAFLATGRPIDVLINNAGLAGQQGMTRDGFELTLGTNHLGPYLLTQLLLPRLKEAPQGRIVNVASRAQERVKAVDWEAFRRPSRGAGERIGLYGVSKLLNVLHAKELARRLTGTKVTTYALHPGVVASDVWRALPRLVQWVGKRFMITNEEGALTSLYCATSPGLSTTTGRYYDKSAEYRVNPLSDDPALAAELFRRSDEWIAASLAA